MVDDAARHGTMTCRLVAFDFDGTLADSLDCFLAALSEASRRHGFRDADPALRPALRGMSARDIIRTLEVPMWKVPRVTADMRRLMQPRIAHIALFPGVEPTFDALAARGIHIAIASSNTEAIVRDRLGAPASRRVAYFACGISLFGKARRLRALAREAGVRPGEMLYVGDEIRDADAARRAGVAFQGVAWGYTAPDALQSHCATPLLPTLDALLDCL
ncbi:hydrolase [Burkholderia pseudomultivorans]|uniref:Hydrolase n=2 Tax=Burkholderia pseudomultivorans TaxID=1207504 RepID=A0A6P2LVD5_9BURK|nr:hydrolase [Burkholderia pseudomultivorans]